MDNVFRTLAYNDEVSLTLVDSTEIVREAMRLHAPSRAALNVLGKVLTIMTYMSASLKEEIGDISVSVKGNGSLGVLSASGNYALAIRGMLEHPNAEEDSDEAGEMRCFGTEGTLAVIRKDGESMPFVGSVGLLKEGGVDGAFEEYYCVSEQLPTYITTKIQFDGEGRFVKAGGIVLQPLPFASGETLSNLPSVKERERILETLFAEGAESCLNRHFSRGIKDVSARKAAYKCNCSREYLSGVLVSLGYGELNDILKTDGEVKIHCHYCNKDYSFFREDIDRLFFKKGH